MFHDPVENQRAEKGKGERGICFCLVVPQLSRFEAPLCSRLNLCITGVNFVVRTRKNKQLTRFLKIIEKHTINNNNGSKKMTAARVRHS